MTKKQPESPSPTSPMSPQFDPSAGAFQSWRWHVREKQKQHVDSRSSQSLPAARGVRLAVSQFRAFRVGTVWRQQAASHEILSVPAASRCDSWHAAWGACWCSDIASAFATWPSLRLLDWVRRENQFLIYATLRQPSRDPDLGHETHPVLQSCVPCPRKCSYRSGLDHAWQHPEPSVAAKTSGEEG